MYEWNLFFQAYYRYMVATAVYYGADKESQNIIMFSWYYDVY